LITIVHLGQEIATAAHPLSIHQDYVRVLAAAMRENKPIAATTTTTTTTTTPNSNHSNHNRKKNSLYR